MYPVKKVGRTLCQGRTLVNGLLITMAFVRNGYFIQWCGRIIATKRYHKNNLDCTGTSEKTYCSGTTKKIMGKIEHWN